MKGVSVFGHSSSGLIEVPPFKVGTVNVGDRQKGLIKAASVIDCAPEKSAIIDALGCLYSEEFQRDLQNTTNPYGDGGASEKIFGILRTYPLTQLLKKSFYDFPRAPIV